MAVTSMENMLNKGVQYGVQQTQEQEAGVQGLLSEEAEEQVNEPE